MYFRACFYLGELPNSPGHKVQVRRRLLLTVNISTSNDDACTVYETECMDRRVM